MGAWAFIDPYLEWVLAHIDAKQPARALYRAARIRFAGDRHDVEASGRSWQAFLSTTPSGEITHKSS